MSDELRKDESENQDEVEGHFRRAANDEPAADEENDNEVEAHVRRANVRMDLPRQD